jgi:ETC complex I subunit conserved region
LPAHAADTGEETSMPVPERHAPARIYRPARTAMQSGRAVRDWVLEFAPAEPQFVGPLMGWTASRDMDREVSLHFPTCEQAVAYAERRGLAYAVEPDNKRAVTPKSYADNFRDRDGLPRAPH